MIENLVVGQSKGVGVTQYTMLHTGSLLREWRRRREEVENKVVGVIKSAVDFPLLAFEQTQLVSVFHVRPKYPGTIYVHD